MNPLDILGLGFKPSADYIKSISEKLDAFNKPVSNTINSTDQPTSENTNVLNESRTEPTDYMKSVSDKLNIFNKLDKSADNSKILNESCMHETVDADGRYKVYRDKDEIFECNVSVEGASLLAATVRLIFMSDTWNIFFDGSIKNGKCVVPLKKMVIFEEGTTGEVKLEIVIDNAKFIPWREKFIVEKPMKVEIAVNTVKSISIS